MPTSENLKKPFNFLFLTLYNVIFILDYFIKNTNTNSSTLCNFELWEPDTSSLIEKD